MKKIIILTSIVMIVVSSLSFTTFGALEPSVYDQFGFKEHGFVAKSIVASQDISGDEYLSANNPVDVTVRYTIIIPNSSVQDRDMQAFFSAVIRPICMDYENGKIDDLKSALKGKLEFGDKNRQPLDYKEIRYINREAYTGRFCFNNGYGSGNLDSRIYKYPNTAINQYTFDCVYEFSRQNLFSKYDVYYGDLGDTIDAFANVGFYFYPVLVMDDFISSRYDDDKLSYNAYMSIERITVRYNRPAVFFQTAGNYNQAVSTIVTNANIPFVVGAYDDDRYQYDAKIAYNTKFSVSGQVIPNPELGYIEFNQDLLDGYYEHWEIPCFEFYSVGVEPITSQYTWNEYGLAFINQLIDSANNRFDYYMRVGVHQQEQLSDYDVQTWYFNNVPLSVSTWQQFSPATTYGFTHSNDPILGYDYNSLYKDVTYSRQQNESVGDYLVRVIFTNTLSIVYNAILGLALETPLIGPLVKTMFMMGKITADYILGIGVSVFSAITILGVLFFTKVFVSITNKFIK